MNTAYRTPQLLRLNRKTKYLFIIGAAITFLSISLAYMFFLSGHQGLYWDANSYYELGKHLAKEGLFAFYNETRTYGYPLFIAIVWLGADHLPSTIRFLVFNAQLLVFLGICFFALYVSKCICHKIELAWGLFAVLALNPFLLIYTGVLLSDLLSAVTIFLALLLAVYPSSHEVNITFNRVKYKIASTWEIHSFLSFFVAGYSTMVRPANFTIVVAIAAVWLLRYLSFKEISGRSLLLMLLGFLLPFIPQLINNYNAVSQIQPLIVRNLYGEQLSWGMQYLKYISIVLPGDTRGIMYHNPFLPSEVSTLSEFFLQKPFEFFLTQGVHLFALFDYDYAFPYITDLRAWYRFPFAVANFTYLFGALTGVTMWIPKVRHPGSFSRLDLALAGMLLGILTYLPGYILTAVEPRFSLPVYLLLGLFFVYMVWQIQTELTQKQWRLIAFQVLGLGMFLFLNLSLSRWLSSQAPLLDTLANSPNALSKYTYYNLQTKFGDRIELISYGVGQIEQIQGGQSIYLALTLVCNGASTESNDVQINLVDSKDRIWSQAVHDTHNKISPCINSFWERTDEVTDVVTLRLPPTMPTGKYRVQMSIYDPAHARFLAVQDSGELVGNWLYLSEIAIAKNQSPFFANQLYIENPFFVDMGEMRLLGYTSIPEKVRAGNELEIGFYWRAREIPRSDYFVAVQLKSSDGTTVAEDANRPAEGSYSTLLWKAGEVLLDWHILSLPRSFIATDYELIVSLQDAITRQVVIETRITNITVLP